MTYSGPWVDTLFVNGTDIQSIDGLRLEDASGLHTEGEYRGDNLVLPGRPGAVSYAKVRGAFVFDLPVTLLGGTRAGFMSVLSDVRDLTSSGNLCTLMRRLTDGVSYVDDWADGEYLAGQAVTLLNAANGRTVLSFLNLDGDWSPTS